jgi:hypothetical protein
MCAQEGCPLKDPRNNRNKNTMQWDIGSSVTTQNMKTVVEAKEKNYCTVFVH